MDVIDQPRPDTIAWHIAQHARDTPQAPAILAPGRAALDFAGLAAQMSRTAETLARAGLGGSSRIALALRNGPEMAVALLATTACATCVPLNPDNDEAMLRSLYRRLRVDAVVVGDTTPPNVAAVAQEARVSIVTLSASRADPAGVFGLACPSRGPAMQPVLAQPDAIAFVLSTSGTTGRPKAVPLTQRNLAQTASTRVRSFGMSARDRSLCATPLFTGSGIRRGLLPPLAAGGSVVCVEDFEPDAMLDRLVEFQATFYAAGPTLHQALVEAIARRGSAPPHALRFIVSGTASLAPDLHARLEQTFRVPVIQTYAMTETGTIAQNALPPGERRPGSVGRPEHTDVAIVAEDGRFLRSGEPGEIVVRGPFVFGGYEDDPEANRDAFLGGWFRTGDLGYVDADGYLHVTGRVKETINRAGFKVPPAEVDAALLRHPAVVDAATFGIAHPSLGEDVIAAVVLRDDPDEALPQVREFAFSQLAPFKVPTRIVAVPRIPRSALGKVSRRTLGDALGIVPRPLHAPPNDGRETIVAAFFAEVLGDHGIGRHDNFFSLGGDSLRATQVVARAMAHFDCTLDATSLFRRPTVAEFATEIDAACARIAAMTPPPITLLPRSGTSCTDVSTANES